VTRRAGRALLIASGGAALVLALFLWCAHPVCVRLSDETVAEAARYGPLETRTDRQLHGPVWQRRHGRWYQCKSWISRQLFF
jgi:hypothetical protein